MPIHYAIGDRDDVLGQRRRLAVLSGYDWAPKSSATGHKDKASMWKLLIDDQYLVHLGDKGKSKDTLL